MVFRQVVGSTYRTPDGSAFSFNMMSHTIALDENGKEIEGIFEESAPLKHYSFDQVELEILDCYSAAPESPIVLPLR